MELFKIIPDNFFSLLSSKNKAVYAGCIIEAFKVYEEGSILGIDKKIVIEVLTDYLDKEIEEIDDLELYIDSDKPSSRDKANFILRRMEECGWIDVDVSNDYVEIINFRDYAITVIESLLQIEPDNGKQNEYRGYIYTIYSLLTNSMNVDYGVLLDQIYRNTKLFIRELRKLDSHLKEYIKSIVDRTEIKDLMESLIEYKVELVDKAYYRLKTSDNINKYRLEIVNKLEGFLMSSAIMEKIALSYSARYGSYENAHRRATRDITEVIDIFNSLDEMITEIDAKNKVYINSTIGKIDFLLKDDNNIPGKINVILKHISNMHKQGKVDSAINMIQPIFRLCSSKSINEASLYTPRGAYSKPEPQKLIDNHVDIMNIATEFFRENETIYTEENVLKFVNENMDKNMLQASKFITENSTIEDILMLVYSLIYTNSDEEVRYKVTKLDNLIENSRYKFNDFLITREDQ